MRAFAVLPCFVAIIAGPALAQDRTPQQRQTLVALARVMGESQALRQACLGAGDQHWRSRFTSLVDNEQPDEDFAKVLAGAFNAGVAMGRKSFSDCSPTTREAQFSVAERGRELASDLASAQRRVPGWMPSLPQDEAEQVTDDTSPR